MDLEQFRRGDRYALPYQVQEGDTLDSIAAKFATFSSDIVASGSDKRPEAKAGNILYAYTNARDLGKVDRTAIYGTAAPRVVPTYNGGQNAMVDKPTVTGNPAVDALNAANFKRVAQGQEPEKIAGVSQGLAPQPGSPAAALIAPPAGTSPAGTPATGSTPAQGYVVQQGDTLSGIAAKLGVPVSSITGFRSGNPNLIFPGEQLTIAGAGGTPATGTQTGVGGTTSASTTTGGTVSSGSSTDALFQQFGVPVSTNQSIEEVIKTVAAAYGIESVTKEMEKEDNAFAAEVQKINDNPWYSEALRTEKIRNAEGKYERRKAALVERLRLQTDVVGRAIDVYYKEKDLAQENLKIALNEKQQAIDNELARAKLADPNTQVVERADGSKVLIDMKTGRVISTIGGAAPGGANVVVGGGSSSGGGSTGGGGVTPGYNIYGKALTAEQAKALGYAQRVSDSSSIIASLESKLTGVGALINQFSPNFTRTPEYQQFDQAKRNFVNAVLRRESGAAISESEFDNANRQYFPQVGDSAAVLTQKRQNRERTLQNLMIEAGQIVPGGSTAGMTPLPSAGTATVSDLNYVMSLKLR